MTLSSSAGVQNRNAVDNSVQVTLYELFILVCVV